jgi:Tfp pilus assembly protein PilX
MGTTTKKIWEDQSGAALVIALLMMIMLTLIGMGAIFTSTFEVQISGNKRGSTDAFYAAESGLQVALANISNFNPSNYVDNRYDPFTDPSNPNPTHATVSIEYLANQNGAPRGLGVSATNFEFMYFNIQSVGQDQTASTPVRSTTTLEQKVVRLIPTLQGGY